MPPIFGKESHVLQSTGWVLENLPSKNAAKGLFYGGDGRMLGATIVGAFSRSNTLTFDWAHAVRCTQAANCQDRECCGYK
jgi:hypothetical protein